MPIKVLNAVILWTNIVVTVVSNLVLAIVEIRNHYYIN